MKLRLNLRDPTENNEKKKDAVKKAVNRKKDANETLDEAWARIFKMKNTDADLKRLREVKKAMEVGIIGREPTLANKRFSKAEALRLWQVLSEKTREKKLKELVAKTPPNFILIENTDDLQVMIDDINKSDLIALDVETFGDDGGALDPWRGEMAGFSVSTRRYNYYVPLNHAKTPEGFRNISDGEIVEMVKPALENARTVQHNAPFDCKWFYVKYGVNLIDNLHADTRIMAMLLDENRSHALKDLITDWLNDPSDNFDELFGNTPFNEIDLDVALVYAAGDTEKTLRLYEWMLKHFDRREDLKRLKRLLFEIEMPVARTFIWADIRGINFDVEAARKLDEQYAREESELISSITRIFGEEINLNSPAQLSKKLFGDLKLPNIANGSTGVKALKNLKSKHEVVPMILQYREVGKLRQSFTQKLPTEIKADGKIHPWHNTLGAATGRFTCNDPNTQQIPAKRPEVRKLFTATGPDRILVSMDFSQIELRVLAHLANEKVLIKAFNEGRDIHSTTAAMISGGEYTYEEIEKYKDVEGHPCSRLRGRAKTVNFGIVYGMSAKGLASTLEITEREAQQIIDNYFAGYPGISAYMDEQKRLAKQRGYVTDMFGRKRRLRQFYRSKDKFDHFRADRMAGNFPIQASAASMLKKAIVDLGEVLPKYDSYILLQVHDELIFDCPRDIPKEGLLEIRDTMVNAVKLVVPVRSDIEIYPERWMEKVDFDEWFS